MKTDYCLFINRQSRDGEDFTDLPFGDLERLTKVAEAALRVPYVTRVKIDRKIDELDGCPWWGPLKPNYEKENPSPSGFYTIEERFKQDLRASLQDNQLFDELYRNKSEWRRFVESR